jgi:hypothetical protein
LLAEPFGQRQLISRSTYRPLAPVPQRWLSPVGFEQPYMPAARSAQSTAQSPALSDVSCFVCILLSFWRARLPRPQANRLQPYPIRQSSKNLLNGQTAVGSPAEASLEQIKKRGASAPRSILPIPWLNIQT